MYRKLQRAFLLLALLVFSLGSMLSVVLLFAAICSPLDLNESIPRRIGAYVVLIIPLLILWWAIKLVPQVDTEIHPRLSRSLIYFYSVVFLYCAMWLVSPTNRDGVSRNMFGHQEVVLGLVILVIPLLVTVFAHFVSVRR